MKTISTFLTLALGTLTGLLVTHFALAGAEVASAKPDLRTYSSFDRPSPGQEESFPAGTIKFQGSSLDEVFKSYQTFSGRTIVRSGNLPTVVVTLESVHPLTRREALQLLDTALAEVGVTMIPQGTTCVKAVPQAQAGSESAPIPDLTRDQLPDSLSYMTYMVDLKGKRPSSLAPLLSPFSKTPNSIILMPESDLLILRDYSSNIRRMLQILDRVQNQGLGLER